MHSQVPNEKWKNLNQNMNFSLFLFVLIVIFKKWHILVKNKHHNRKEHGPKPYDIDFSDDSLISSKKNNNDENATKFRSFWYKTGLYYFQF